MPAVLSTAACMFLRGLGIDPVTKQYKLSHRTAILNVFPGLANRLRLHVHPMCQEKYDPFNTAVHGTPALKQVFS